MILNVQIVIQKIEFTLSLNKIIYVFFSKKLTTVGRDPIQQRQTMLFSLKFT